MIIEKGIDDMKLADLLTSEHIIMDLKSQSKNEVLEELCGHLVGLKKLPQSKEVVRVLLEREALGSTGIGQGIAIPHAKTDEADKQIAALGISKRGLDFHRFSAYCADRFCRQPFEGPVKNITVVEG
jgi:nitrogen PTS system EIIA component